MGGTEGRARHRPLAASAGLALGRCCSPATAPTRDEAPIPAILFAMRLPAIRLLLAEGPAIQPVLDRALPSLPSCGFAACESSADVRHRARRQIVGSVAAPRPGRGATPVPGASRAGLSCVRGNPDHVWLDRSIPPASRLPETDGRSARANAETCALALTWRVACALRGSEKNSTANERGERERRMSPRARAKPLGMASPE